MTETQRLESLGPAERIIRALTSYTDHASHGRPGVLMADGRSPFGVRWVQATWVQEGDSKIVYRVDKVGKKVQKTRLGVMNGTNDVVDNGRVVCQYKRPGLFPHAIVHMYKQIWEVWKLDNEFAAKWASWAWLHEDNRDLKVLLAAFMLVQNRFGEAIWEGATRCQDDDYRTVGEAMCLRHDKGKTFSPKMLLRVGEVLSLPEITAINRELGFGRTARRAIYGRYIKVIEKYLANLERNPKVIEWLVGSGFRTTLMKLARKAGYKPEGELFFELLRWKQKQAPDGRRTIAIGKAVREANNWRDFSETQICEAIMAERPSYKVVVGRLPRELGLTPAIMAATIEAGVLSDQELIILTPTLEGLGLLENKDVFERWKRATERAENQRAANIKKNVRSQRAQAGLQKAVDTAAAKAVEEVTRDLRVYIAVDISGSMTCAIDKAKALLTKFVGAFPLDRLHVCVFNTGAKMLRIEAQTQAAVAKALRGYSAGGGTLYESAIRQFANFPPKPGEDALVIFVGDQLDDRTQVFISAFARANLKPVAFGMLHVESPYSIRYPSIRIVEQAAARMDIPCLSMDEAVFDDVYAIPRTLRNLIASTPVSDGVMAASKVNARNVLQKILDTPLLQKPVWA